MTIAGFGNNFFYCQPCFTVWNPLKRFWPWTIHVLESAKRWTVRSFLNYRSGGKQSELKIRKKATPYCFDFRRTVVTDLDIASAIVVFAKAMNDLVDENVHSFDLMFAGHGAWSMQSRESFRLWQTLLIALLKRYCFGNGLDMHDRKSFWSFYGNGNFIYREWLNLSC